MVAVDAVASNAVAIVTEPAAAVVANAVADDVADGAVACVV